MPLLPSHTLKPLKNDPRLARCGHCGLCKNCDFPKMTVTGKGRAGVLVITEYPGREEDRKNRQLVGPAGQMLRRCLREIDVDLDQDCWKTSAVICCPESKPSHDQVMDCRSNLLKTIRELNPRMILAMGSLSVSSLMGWLWKEKPGGMEQWAGWRIPSQQLNAWVCPVFCPSYVRSYEEKSEKQKTKNKERGRVVSIMFREHLEQAFALRDRPWKKVPEYEKQVRIEMDGGKAAKAIELLVYSQLDVPVAFDFETNMLKPESHRAEIVSCSLSNGEETIAFPIVSETRRAVVEFLQSSVPKIAHNLKFEDRWSRSMLETLVRGWFWCTMQTAHVLDNRRGISGLKFQSFVRLGQPLYDESVGPYLEGGSNTPNRIRQASMRDLLLYNGLDSLLCWHLFCKQQKDLEGMK